MLFEINTEDAERLGGMTNNNNSVFIDATPGGMNDIDLYIHMLENNSEMLPNELIQTSTSGDSTGTDGFRGRSDSSSESCRE